MFSDMHVGLFKSGHRLFKVHCLSFVSKSFESLKHSNINLPYQQNMKNSSDIMSKTSMYCVTEGRTLTS